MMEDAIPTDPAVLQARDIVYGSGPEGQALCALRCAYAYTQYKQSLTGIDTEIAKVKEFMRVHEGRKDAVYKASLTKLIADHDVAMRCAKRNLHELSRCPEFKAWAGLVHPKKSLDEAVLLLD